MLYLCKLFARKYTLVNEPTFTIEDKTPFEVKEKKEDVLEIEGEDIVYNSDKDEEQGNTEDLTVQIEGITIIDDNGNRITSLPQTGFDFLLNYAVSNGLVEENLEQQALTFKMSDVINHSEEAKEFYEAEIALPYAAYNLLEWLSYVLAGVSVIALVGVVGLTFNKKNRGA